MRVGPFEVNRGARKLANGNGSTPLPTGAKETFPRDDSGRELGATGGTGSIGGSLVLREYNPDLRGPRAIETFDKMRKGDALVRAILRLVKAPIISAEWYVDPASDDRLDLEIAEFVEWNRHHMSRSWKQVLYESLLMCDFGFYPFEKVFELATWRPKSSKRGPEKTVVKWKKFSPRHPRALNRWVFDANGGVEGMWFQLPLGSAQLAVQQTTNQVEGSSIFIPIDKLLLFTFDEEGGDPNGFGVLRSCYKHWFYKDNLYKIDAIQKERHGIGIPRVKMVPGFSEADKKSAEELGRNLRANEKSYIVEPPGYVVDFVEPKGQMVDVLASIQHHDLMIARSVLGQFINLGSSSDTSGSNALGESTTEIFIRALRYLGDSVAAVFNQYAIRQLVDYNYNVSQYPTLRVRRIGENADWRALSVGIRNFIEAGILTPTPEDETWLRDQIDWPKPPKSARERTTDKRVIERPPRGVPAPEPGGGPAPGTPPGEGPGGETIDKGTAVPAASVGRGGGNRSNRTRKPKDGG